MRSVRLSSAVARVHASRDGIVRHARCVEVVVEPDRVDAELLAAQRAMQDLLVGEAHLRQVDADLGLAHGRSSNLPWVMVVVAVGDGLEGERMLGDAKGIHRQVGIERSRRCEPHRDPPNPVRVVDAQQGEQAVSADRHGAQAVGEDEIEPGRSCRGDVEVMGRPVAGHLRVATCHVLVDVVGDGSDGTGPGVVGEPVISGRTAEIGDPLQAEQHHRPPLLDGDRSVGVDLVEPHDDLSTCPGCPYRRYVRPGVQRFTGDQRPVQHDVVCTVHPAADVLPDRVGQVGSGRFVRSEHQDHRKHRGHCKSVQTEAVRSPVAAA